MKKKYEVVISGVAGRFPESEDIIQLEQNLLNKKNLITNDDRRWKQGPPFPEVPCSTGKINERDTMDMTFFGLHRRLCEVTDPHQRICLELAFSAILDAGVNPNDLWGSNTAVLTNSVTSETEYECLMDIMNIGLAILGHSRSMQANRISYCLNLSGPSLMIDGSWNGGAEAFAYATDLIERGAIRAAVIASCSIIYTAEVAFHYYRMGRLTPGDKTMCFSDDASGYNRSEGSVAFFLQRKDDALRSYGSPLSTSVTFNGSKKEAFSEMSKEAMRWYLETFYNNAKIDPGLISYVEASGVASKAVDAAELNGIGEVMLSGRKKPLLVGSIKSNLGHTEASSSSVSIAKAILVSNSGVIPPNLNYNKPNSLVPYLASGEIQVVTEPTPLDGDYIAVNSISSTSGFAHVVIKRHDKEKIRVPEKNVLPPDGLPRLLLLSGRNEDGLRNALNKVEEKPIDEEYVALVNNVFKKGIKKHLYRGYTVLNDKEKSCSDTKAFFTGGQKMLPVWWVFTGMGSQWTGMGVELMKLPVFAKAIHKCQKILSTKGVDLLHIITTQDPKIFDNILHSFVGIAAMQIGLVDVLKEIGLEPDGIIGHSVGELGCAYADGCFTAEQMILAAYARGKASIEVELIQGMMAAVGRGYKQIKDDVPDGIEVACHNSSDSCTLSGPTQLMEEYIDKLKARGIFAKLVNVANIAYHSKYIRPAAPALLRYLKEVVPEPKLRSSKWISSSVPESEWGRETARYSSAEYHTNNLLGSVLFEEATVHIPKNAVIVEIAPHGLLQAILKRSFPAAVHIPLTNRIDPNGLIFLFNSLGKLFLEGAAMDIEKLYPSVEFPVSRGTASLNDLIIWDHSEQWRINLSTALEDYSVDSDESLKPRQIKVNLKKDQFKFLSEHVINNQVTIPLSFYLENVTKDFQKLRKSVNETLFIQNIKMSSHVQVLKDDSNLYMSIGKGTGAFEVCHDLDAVVSGDISYVLRNLKVIGMPSLGTDLTEEAVYSYLKSMGHELGPKFRLIRSATISESDVSAVVEWNGDLVCFLDAILKIPALLSIEPNKLKLVNNIKNLTIDFSKFNNNEKKDLLVNYNSITGILICEGLEALYPKSESLHTDEHPDRKILCQDLQLVPYDDSNITDLNQLLVRSIQILFNNIHDIDTADIELSVFEVQESLDVHDMLYDVLKWKREVEINLKVASTDSSLDGYIADNKREYCFILTGSSELENTISVLNSSRDGFILLKGQQPPSSLATVFSVVIENEQYSLCRARRLIKKNQACVLMTSEDWRSQLKTSLFESNNRAVYLLGTETSLSVINSNSKECNTFLNSHLLRYIYIDSEISEFDFMAHKEQLEKDLKVNILQNGKWGVCLTHPINLEVNPSISKLAVYQFSDVKCEGGIFPKVVSLNLTDVSCTLKKLEVFEYGGICIHEDIVGIAKFCELSRTMIPDPIFQWKKPEGWTFEEATSVLVPYCMAFYMLKIGSMGKVFKDKKNVFAPMGLLPLSQAFINTALCCNKGVYTTYKTPEEKERIMELFPEIPEERILNSDTDQYDVTLQVSTNGEGMDVILNSLPESSSLQKLLNSLGVEGVLYQASQPVILEDDKMGMHIFLKQTVVAGISPPNILDFHDSLKRKLHSLIQEGFDDKTIKPLPHKVLSSDFTNVEAVSVISDSMNSDRKILVRLGEYGVKNPEAPYNCNIFKSHAVLGDNGGFWIDLIEWLMKRGANVIYIIVTKNMLTGLATKRLRRLQSLNPLVNLVLTPESRVMNLQATEMFINGVNTTIALDTVFVVGEEFKYTVEYLAQVLKSEKLVVLCEGADLLCEQRISMGLPTLAISVLQNLLTSHVLIPRLDKLLTMARQKVILTEQTINYALGIDVERTAYIQHLPSTVSEILDLSRCPKEAEWREVKSSSPISRACPELSPVFLIPPLKKGQLNTLLKSLFHPTFVAVPPIHFENFQDLAEQLHQGLKRFTTGVFTIICSDWSWIVGLLIGKLLEADGKEVSLIFFESSITWDSPAAFHQVRCLVNKDLALSSLNDSQKQKLTVRIEEAYKILKNRLSLFSHELPEVKQKLKGICHYVRPNIILKTERLAKIQAHCERPLNIYTAEDFDFLRMMEDRKLIHYINTFILFEYKDAANRIDKKFVNEGIFQNPRLSYLNFMQSLHQNKCQSCLGPNIEPTPL